MRGQISNTNPIKMQTIPSA